MSENDRIDLLNQYQTAVQSAIAAVMSLAQSVDDILSWVVSNRLLAGLSEVEWHTVEAITLRHDHAKELMVEALEKMAVLFGEMAEQL